jgi:hypothetical protein
MAAPASTREQPSTQASRRTQVPSPTLEQPSTRASRRTQVPSLTLEQPSTRASRRTQVRSLTLERRRMWVMPALLRTRELGLTHPLGSMRELAQCWTRALIPGSK